MMDGACQHETRSPGTGSFLPLAAAIDRVRNCDVATGLTHDTIKMMNDVHQQDRDRTSLDSGNASIQWRTRYDGLVTIAELGGKAVAGISGPWSGQYALTWWDRPLPTRSLDLFDSLDEAKTTVEDWAQRMRTGNYSRPGSIIPPARTQIIRSQSIVAAAVAVHDRARLAQPPQPTLLGRVRALLPDLRPQKQTLAAAQNLERLRQQHAGADSDLGDDLHFSAKK